MVQEEISELLSESTAWKDSLKNYRESFVQSQKRLLEIASNIPKEELSELERFQNQFYIQLLNIHDVRRNLKNHIKDLSMANGESDVEKAHEDIKNEYRSLEETLQNLSTEFEEFSKHVQN